MYASCFVYCVHSQSPHSEQHVAVFLLRLHFKDNTVCVIEHISFNSVIYSQYNIFGNILCRKIKNCLRKCWISCGEQLKPDTAGVLQSPFIDSNGNTATKLSPKQSCYFMAIFFFNILVYIRNIALLFIIFGGSVDQRQKTNELIDVNGLIFQFASQLCVVFSCFIFSKVAYSVRSTCTQKLPELFNKVDEAANINEDDEELQEEGYIMNKDIDEANGSQLHLLINLKVLVV